MHYSYVRLWVSDRSFRQWVFLISTPWICMPKKRTSIHRENWNFPCEFIGRWIKWSLRNVGNRHYRQLNYFSFKLNLYCMWTSFCAVYPNFSKISTSANSSTVLEALRLCSRMWKLTQRTKNRIRDAGFVAGIIINIYKEKGGRRKRLGFHQIWIPDGWRESVLAIRP